MTKDEAVKRYVSRELNAIPREWVEIIAGHYGKRVTLPMWGTMWIVSTMDGEKLIEHSRIMARSDNTIDFNCIKDKEERKRLKKAINDDNYPVIEQYVDEEMAGERCVLDKDGNATALFVYEIGDEYVIGVNGAGWDFYDGVWDKLYDLLGLQWHTEQ